jgi:hypothetical protein
MLDAHTLDLVEELQFLAVDLLPPRGAGPLGVLSDACADVAAALLAGEDDMEAAASEIFAATHALLVAADRVLLSAIAHGGDLDAATGLLATVVDVAGRVQRRVDRRTVARV